VKKTKRKLKTYTPEEKEKALAAVALNGGRIRKTARELNIPEATLNRWLKKQDVDLEDLRKRKQEEAIIIIWDAIMKNLIRCTDQEAINEQSSKECGIVAAKLIEKVLLLQGNATERREVLFDGQLNVTTIIEATKERLRLFEKLAGGMGTRNAGSAISEESSGTNEVSGGSDSKYFVYHQQSRSKATALAQQSAAETP